MIKLYPYQKLAIKFAKENQNAFIEAPTGSGKSIMISYLAKEFLKQGKKVVISTSTNQLVLELLSVLKEKFDINEADIVVGKNNYIDIENIDLKEISEIVKNRKITKEFIVELAKLIENQEKNEYLLIDVFLNKFDIDESTKELLEKILSSNSKKDYIKDFTDYNISVTNHYYLIYKLLFSKDDYSDYVFILDETHQITEAMETIFTMTFSLFRFRFLLKKTIQEIKFLEFRGQKSLYKALLKLNDLTDTLFNLYTNEKLVGLSFLNDEKQIKIIKKIIKYLTDEKTYNKLKKSNYDSKTKNLLLEEWKELFNIARVSEKDITIYYSPAKGYPSLSATKEDVYPKMKFLWENMNEVKGFSATLSIPTNDEYFKTRLNIQKEVAFFKIPPVFKKTQIKYKLVESTFPTPKTTEDSVDIEWIKKIGDYILNTYDNKNSLILMGGFLEVDNLYAYLSLKLNDTPLLKAEKNKSVYSIIEQFKKQGGILIATRNYGTGIDLKGALLEKLYIAKLPYPVIGNKKWLDIIQRDKLKKTNIAHFMMLNEMLLNLKQWIGRLIRTPEDKGELYILDSRVNKANIKPKVIKLIESIFI